MRRPLILMYHRIADEPVDYWGLAVSPGHFEEQLSVLRRTRQPLPLMEFVHRLVDNTLPMDAVALTFDDGYVDNLTAGLPRLVAADMPATVFLATGFLDRREPFWWDELARLILLETGSKRFVIAMHGQSMCFEIGVEAPSGKDGTKSVPWTKSRRDLLEEIYHPIRLLNEEQRQATMAQLRAIFAGRNDGAQLGRPMTSDEVRALVAGGPVTVGAHTVSHPSLPSLGAQVCRHEVAESRRACDALVGGPVTAFAYPYGEYDALVREAVRSAGFTFACSTRRGPAIAESDVFTLPRIYIPDINGDAFEQRVRWASGEG
jgi:peptidoglycan/xylan/chitin deacetylase (PgdA/CDA1 family)